jgi:hypothetical protein
VYKKRSKGGRPSYVPTDKDRKVVESMAAYGITQSDISLAIGVAPMTLRKHFAHELATAHIKANAKVCETAYNMAISGKCPAATFFGSNAAPDGGRLSMSIRDALDLTARRSGTRSS